MWKRLGDDYRAAIRQIAALRGPILIALVVSLAIMATDQFQEILRGLASHANALSGSTTAALIFSAVTSLLYEGVLSLFAVAGLCAVSLWFWSRFTLSSLGLTSPDQPPIDQRFSRTSPRVVGSLPLLALIGACFRAHLTDFESLNAALNAMAVIFGVLAAVFFRAFRDAYVGKQSRRVPGADLPDQLDDATEAAMRARVARPLDDVRTVFWRLNFPTKVALSVTGAAWLLLFIGFTFWPQWLGPRIGSEGLVLIWGAVAVAPVAFICLAAQYFRLPIAGALILFAALWSGFDTNDNHLIELAPVPKTSIKQKELVADFKDWLANRPDGELYANRPYPVIFVATQGGGIRAAYFSAITLSMLQDSCASFASHVYIISAVSGGSVGSGIFASLLQEQSKIKSKLAPPPCIIAIPSDYWRAPGWFSARAEEISGKESLSPVLGSMLFPDLFQRFVPFRLCFAGVCYFDRGRAQVLAWETAWRRRMHDSLLAQPVSGLHGQGSPWLIFNSTRVEDGRPYPIKAFRFPEAGLASDWDYTWYPLAPDRLSVSWAMSLSARFPWITPTATVPEQLANARGCSATQAACPFRLADGGYYENSGAGVLGDIALQLANDPDVRKKHVGGIAFHFLIVTNGDAVTNAQDVTSNTAQPTQKKAAESPLYFENDFGELLDPLRALMNTRSARGGFATRQAQTLEGYVAGQNALLGSDQRNLVSLKVHAVRICRGGVPIPLGWYLSDAAKEEMQAQLIRDDDCVDAPTSNRKVLEALLQSLL